MTLLLIFDMLGTAAFAISVIAGLIIISGLNFLTLDFLLLPLSFVLACGLYPCPPDS